MKNPGCKSSSGQGMEEARNNFSVAAEKKSKAERRLFWRHRERDKAKVHFATLVDTCHLKNAELEPQFQKYKGRVVFRGDIVMDVSGATAVFTE